MPSADGESTTISPFGNRSTVAPRAVRTSDMMSTSTIRGTLLSTWRPSAKRQATMSLSAEFLAPPAVTVPESGPLGRITMRSTAPV